MQASIDERREVAQRLRLMEPGEVNWDALAEAVFADGRPHMRVNVADRLADLIDPTPWANTVSATEAAELLGISKGRVSTLVKKGKLDTVLVEGRSRVTIASVNERLRNPPAPHRPKADA